MKMKSIRNIKIKTKLLLLGGISLLGMIFIGAESIITARQINEASTVISQSWEPAMIIAEELNTKTSDYRIREYNHVITKDEKDMDRLEGEMAQIRGDIDAAFQEYELYTADESDRKLMVEAKGDWNKYLLCSDRLLTVSRDNHKQEAFAIIMGESHQLFRDASNGFLKVADYNRQGSEAASLRGDELYARMIRIKIVTISLAGAVIFLLVLYIIIAIDKPVKAIVEGTRRVSNGDLNVYLSYYSEDEIGILTDSVNQLIDRLKNIIDDEKYLLREIGSENFEVRSTCEQAYRGDFASILYSITSLMSRLDAAKKKKINRAEEEKVLSLSKPAEEKKEEPAVKAACKEIEEHDSRDMDASDKKS